MCGALLLAACLQRPLQGMLSVGGPSRAHLVGILLSAFHAVRLAAALVSSCGCANAGSPLRSVPCLHTKP